MRLKSTSLRSLLSKSILPNNSSTVLTQLVGFKIQKANHMPLLKFRRFSLKQFSCEPQDILSQVINQANQAPTSLTQKSMPTQSSSKLQAPLSCKRQVWSIPPIIQIEIPTKQKEWCRRLTITRSKSEEEKKTMLEQLRESLRKEKEENKSFLKDSVSTNASNLSVWTLKARTMII